MGKTKKPGKKAPIYPLVSLCTPTYNRRPFIETMFECYRNQTYPKNRIEWVIVDDGTDKIEDLVKDVEKIQEQMESMMHNKVNIQRLQKDVDKIIDQLEIVKDKVRANGGHTK